MLKIMIWGGLCGGLVFVMVFFILSKIVFVGFIDVKDLILVMIYVVVMFLIFV